MRDIIFNELSLSISPFPDAANAKKAFESFVAEMATAIDDGLVRSVFRSQISLLDESLPLVDGEKWSIYDWFEDPGIDRDARRLILTLDAKVPIEADYPLSEEDEAVLLAHSFKVHGKAELECFAFGFALHTGSIVASIPSDKLWMDYLLPGQVVVGETTVKDGVVFHISQADHSEKIAELIIAKAKDSIDGRAEFVAMKEQAFPHLRFSPDVDGQVEALTARQIITLTSKLARMNSTAEKWRSSGASLPCYEFNWRGESEQTMGRQEYRTARTFRMPDGNKVIFESHLDFSASHRIHFIEDTVEKTFIIGYVGEHLPTVKYKH